MPKITISKDTQTRLNAFLTIMRQILEDEHLDVDQAADVLIITGMKQFLATLWKRDAGDALVNTLQGLADKHPDEVFTFVAEALARGAAAHREELKALMGRTMNIFAPPKEA
jgi:hypothetical protein